MWLNDPDNNEISPKEKQIFRRLKKSYELLQIEKQQIVVKRIMREFGISEAQAYNDIRDCKFIFNPINSYSISDTVAFCSFIC